MNATVKERNKAALAVKSYLLECGGDTRQEKATALGALFGVVSLLLKAYGGEQQAERTLDMCRKDLSSLDGRVRALVQQRGPT